MLGWGRMSEEFCLCTKVYMEKDNKTQKGRSQLYLATSVHNFGNSVHELTFELLGWILDEAFSGLTGGGWLDSVYRTEEFAGRIKCRVNVGAKSHQGA